MKKKKENPPEPVFEGIRNCAICSSDFDIDAEGGLSGEMGMLPVDFCPWCLSSLCDMMDQLHLMPNLLKKAWKTAKKGERKITKKESKRLADTGQLTFGFVGKK